MEQQDVTSAEFTEWISALPLEERREKIQRISSKANVSVRTIENWRSGRPEVLDKKYTSIIRAIMKGGDKVAVEMNPETLKGYRKLAAARGLTVTEYLAELLKLLGAVALLAVLTHQVLHPEKGEARRFGRRGKGGSELVLGDEMDELI